MKIASKRFAGAALIEYILIGLFVFICIALQEDRTGYLDRENVIRKTNTADHAACNPKVYFTSAAFFLLNEEARIATFIFRIGGV